MEKYFAGIKDLGLQNIAAWSGRESASTIGRLRRDRTEILHREACFVIAAYPLEAVTQPSITPLTREVLFHSSLVTYFLDFPATRR